LDALKTRAVASMPAGAFDPDDRTLLATAMDGPAMGWLARGPAVGIGEEDAEPVAFAAAGTAAADPPESLAGVIRNRAIDAAVLSPAVMRNPVGAADSMGSAAGAMGRTRFAEGWVLPDLVAAASLCLGSPVSRSDRP
jgi:hypothetical protein